MPTSNDAFPSKFISASDLQGREPVVKITHVTSDEIGGKQKYVCFFAGKQKGLVLNKTNWNNIVRISGCDNSDDWTGVNVCLFEAMVDFQGESVPAVRIKSPPKSAQQEQGARPSASEMKQPVKQAAADEMSDQIPF